MPCHHRGNSLTVTLVFVGVEGDVLDVPEELGRQVAPAQAGAPGRARPLETPAAPKGHVRRKLSRPLKVGDPVLAEEELQLVRVVRAPAATAGIIPGAPIMPGIIPGIIGRGATIWSIPLMDDRRVAAFVGAAC